MPRGTRRLPSEQYDGCDEHERCQGGSCQPTQPRLARLSAQTQKTLSPQGVGRQPRNEEGAARRPVTHDRHQHPQPQAQGLTFSHNFRSEKVIESIKEESR
jgi:hypothetical protein